MRESHNPEPAEDSHDIELSAADLLELASPLTVRQLSAGAEPGSGETACAELSQGRIGPVSAREAISTRSRNTPWIAAIGVVSAAVTVASVLNYESPATTEPTLSHGFAQAQAASSPEDATLPEAQSTPVRITNSFDKTEVFEFPPGTSESEARAAVADLLLKRATERMN